MSIKLDPRFYDSVMSEEKWSTVRQGRLEYDLGFTELDFGDVKVWVNVWAVVHAYVHRLCDEGAERDGFNSKSELLAVLKKHYPDLDINDEITIVKWDLIGKVEDDVNA